MSFTTPLQMTRLDGQQVNGNPLYRLDAPLIYEDRGQRYEIPGGFVTDLASIPQRFQDRLPHDGPWAPAAVLHDWLYAENAVPRRQADRTFREAMTGLGVKPRARRAMWGAVRLFGGDAYRQRLGWAPPR